MCFDLPNGGSVQPLQDASFDLKAGELRSVLGPSGCGKPTLLNIIAGFLTTTNGQILLNGNILMDRVRNVAWFFYRVHCLIG